MSCDNTKTTNEIKLTKSEQLDIDYHNTIDSIASAINLEKLKSQIDELHKMDSIAETVITKQTKEYQSSIERNGQEYTDSIKNELYEVSMQFTRLISLKMMCLENNTDTITILEINQELDSLNETFKSIRYK
jgi:hypothetical protein